MKKHIQVCAAKEGITYCFNKGEITSFQVNFNNLSDFPFTVYLDFETTTRDTVFFLTQKRLLWTIVKYTLFTGA